MLGTTGIREAHLAVRVDDRIASMLQPTMLAGDIAADLVPNTILRNRTSRLID